MRKVLAVVLLTGIPLCRQPLWGQAPGIGVEAPKKKPDDTTGSAKPTKAGGTKENPLVVDTLGHQQAPKEREEAQKQAAEAKAEEQYHRDIDRWMLIWNGMTSIATAILVLVGIGGVCAAIWTLRAIRDQGEQSARHLGLTERPWISPSVQLVSPLTADADGIHITLRTEFSNVGKSPAYGVWGMPKLYLPHLSKSNVLDERKRICKEAVANPIGPLGDMIFPNTAPPPPVDWTMKVSAEEIVQACTIGGTNIGFYSVDIILCVSYRSTIDEAARHYTGVIYHLSRIDPRTPGWIVALPAGESVPLEQLRLQGGFPFGTIAE